MKLLQSPWVAALLGAVCFLGTTVVLLQPKNIVPARELHPEGEPVEEEESSASGGNWGFHSPEIDQLIAELKKEKETLAAREQELKELAARLQAERVEMNQATQTVHQMQQEFDKGVLRVKEEEMANLKKLAKLYTTMSPEAAVALFRQMTDDELVKILTFTKDADTAAYLELMSKPGDADKKRVGAIIDRMRATVYRNAGKTNSTP